MKTKSIFSTLFLAAFSISSFGAEYYGTNEYSESGNANSNDYNFRGTYTLTGSSSSSTNDIQYGVRLAHLTHSGTIGSELNPISSKVMDGYNVFAVTLGYGDYTAGRNFSGVYFDEVYAKSTNTVGRWLRGMLLRGADFQHVSVNTLHAETTASTGNAVAIGYQLEAPMVVVNYLDMGVSNVISGTSSGARGINFNGTSAQIGTLAGILNVTANFNDTSVSATTENYFACGITTYANNKTFSINRIEAAITVKSPNWIAIGINSNDANITANMAKNALISAQGKDAANSYAIRANTGYIEINGDSINTQTFKGNIVAGRYIAINAGSYIFDSNFDSPISFSNSTGNDSIDFKTGSVSKFAKSVEFTASDVFFNSGSKIILEANSTSNYSKISSDVKNITAEIGSELELLILGDFEANDGDSMQIVDAGSILSDNFTFAIKALDGTAIDEALYSYADGLVSFHGHVVVPEAAEIAAIFGAIALAFAMLRRKIRK